MSDQVILAIPGVGTLALTRERFEEALKSGREFTAPVSSVAEPVQSPATHTQPSALLDADQLEDLTNIPRTWWMTRARERRIPFRKIGRRVRFVLEEVMACEEFKRTAAPGRR